MSTAAINTLRMCALAWLVSLCWLPAALALTTDTPLPNALDEARAKSLFHQIRCVVCQSEAIADSPADIASDMRREIRAQVASGKSDEDIKSFLVEHYGNFILMDPPLNPATSLLWFGPLIILCLAAWLAARYFRHSFPKKNL